MKTLYFDCGMGAAGDMLAAALLELFPSPDEMIDKLNGIGIPGVRFKNSVSTKCGIQGTHMTVTVNGVEEECGYQPHEHEHGHEHEHEHVHEHEHKHEHQHEHEHEHEHEHGSHHHSKMSDIEHIVRGHISLPAKIQDDVMAVYRLIADAESKAHGVPVCEIHFHEVGTMDAVADIAAVCFLIDAIAPEQIIASPVHVGSGQVRCAHGILPVPAPATAYILRDVPIYGGGIKGELCTPTGAALLKHFVNKFGDMPVMKTKSVGYGMGTKDFDAANCVRAFLGETESGDNEIAELKCNLDDMTPEAVGYVQELLFESGALDVYSIPIVMKKSRPGVLLCCMCSETDTERLAGIILKNTSTLGVRLTKAKRFTLLRKTEVAKTEYGTVRMKISSGYDIERIKPEYEDIVRIARESGMTFAEATELANEAYKARS